MTAVVADAGARRRPVRRKDHDGLSVEWFTLELMRVAYATRGGFLARADPRAVFAFYALTSLAPWFTYSPTVLVLLFLLGAAAATLARIGPLLLGLFVLGQAGSGLYILIFAWFVNGDWGALAGVVLLTVKLGAVSLFTMAAFVSLDPERAADGFLALRAPAVVGFAVNYGYRMMPVLIAEYQTIAAGHRTRRAPVRERGLLGWRWIRRVCAIAVWSFYPLMLNTAKRTRTTVEMLETKGFGYAKHSAAARRIRLAHLHWRTNDTLLLLITTVLLGAAYVAGIVEGASWPML